MDSEDLRGDELDGWSPFNHPKFPSVGTYYEASMDLVEGSAGSRHRLCEAHLVGKGSVQTLEVGQELPRHPLALRIGGPCALVPASIRWAVSVMVVLADLALAMSVTRLALACLAADPAVGCGRRDDRAEIRLDARRRTSQRVELRGQVRKVPSASRAC